jgi:hypothetical protein
MKNEKERKGLSGRAAGSLACGGSDRPDLIFGLPLYQDKGNSLSGN